MWATSVIFKKNLSKVINHQIDENSHNLVILFTTTLGLLCVTSWTIKNVSNLATRQFCLLPKDTVSISSQCRIYGKTKSVPYVGINKYICT
jgi:hypothetical protein